MYSEIHEGDLSNNIAATFSSICYLDVGLEIESTPEEHIKNIHLT